MQLSETLKSLTLAVLMGVAGIVDAGHAQAKSPEVLTVAGGCFWCVESDFEGVPGVIEAVSGYTGGKTKDPTYKDVTKGGSGHYEAVQITFDADQVSRETLLSLFVRSVDPTDAGGQFCDRGESYRTAIFVSNPEEKEIATRVLAQAQSDLGLTIVTPILTTNRFYEAEAYHQDYYKGTNLVFTRFGPKRQSAAYKRYRQACGRDKRVRDLWGNAAPFAKKY